MAKASLQLALRMHASWQNSVLGSKQVPFSSTETSESPSDAGDAGATGKHALSEAALDQIGREVASAREELKHASEWLDRMGSSSLEEDGYADDSVGTEPEDMPEGTRRQ